MNTKPNLTGYTFEDTNIQTVRLGGVSKETGKPNPTFVEGYYVGLEVRTSPKFNKPQNFYKFQTASGLVGLYGSAGMDQAMKGKSTGLKTILINTGEELDTGKGNPMKVYKVGQNSNDRIDVAVSSNLDTESEYGDTLSDEDLEETVSVDEVLAARPVPPSRPAQVSNSTIAQVKAKLAARQTKLA